MFSIHIQEGQRFDKIAQEYSEDKAKGQQKISSLGMCTMAQSTSAAGGNLGWMTRGSMVVCRRRHRLSDPLNLSVCSTGPIPRGRICVDTFHSRQADHIISGQNKFWLSYHNGGRSSMIPVISCHTML